jgi:hypothetical protein
MWQRQHLYVTHRTAPCPWTCSNFRQDFEHSSKKQKASKHRVDDDDDEDKERDAVRLLLSDLRH